MKTLGLLIIPLALFASGCIPSLCLFNCGGDTITGKAKAESRTFEFDGKHWYCAIEPKDHTIYPAIPTRKATCWEVDK